LPDDILQLNAALPLDDELFLEFGKLWTGLLRFLLVLSADICKVVEGSRDSPVTYPYESSERFSGNRQKLYN
jgi:hypothetical protein